MISLAGLILIQSWAASPPTPKPRCSWFLEAQTISFEEYESRIPPIFFELYGPISKPAARLLWEVAGPVFAWDALTRAYGEVWSIPGPVSLRDRSIATVAALVAQELFPQIRIHLNGLLSTGLSVQELLQVVKKSSNTQDMSKLVDAVDSGLQWRASVVEGFRAPGKDEIELGLNKPSALSEYQNTVIELSRQIATGDRPTIMASLKAFTAQLPPGADPDQAVSLLISHLIVYCGYPKGMNAFQDWQTLRSTQGTRLR